MGCPYTRVFVIILIVVSILLPQIYAGTTGKISGQVFDASTTEPLIGVNVVIDNYPYGAATDVDGTYIILNIPPGTYDLRAIMLGYTDMVVKDVKVNIDKTTRVDFKLKETALELGEAVEVIAERLLVKKDLTSSESIIDREEIENLPVENMTDVLNLQAGVTVDPAGEIHIRGGRSNEIAYMVNGVNVNDAYSGDFAIEVENNAIQEMNVISGTFNAEYGQAMSGVVNIVTKEGSNKLEGDIQAFVGNYVSNRDEIFGEIDNFNPIFNLQGTIGGPFPGFNKLKYFLSGRYWENEGYIFGKKVFLPTDSSDFSKENQEDWVIMSHGQTYNFSEEAAEQLIREAESVALEKETRLTGNFKLSYQAGALDKITLESLYQRKDWQEYDHRFLLNPLGNYNRDQYTVTVSGFWNHVFSARTFLDVRGSYLYTDYKQNVYDDIFDEGYVSSSYLQHSGTNAFLSGGQQLWHFYRNTTTYSFKTDLISQVTNTHQLKAGVDLRFSRLNMEEFEVIPEIPERIAPKTSFNNNSYQNEPKEYAFYVQDKMEYNDLIVNFGLRFDYFDPDGEIPLDFSDPANSETRKADASSKLSPRLGIAFSTSEKGKIYVSYGHFFQTPNFFYLYTNPEFEIFPLQSTPSPPPQSELNTVGNAELKPQETIIYELGIQQQLGSQFGISLIGFYKDIRNLLGTEVLKTIQGRKYGRYINRDYAYVRGITFEFQKKFSGSIGANVDYTYQVARGNASDPNTAFLDAQTDPPTETEKQSVPLNWDRTHQLNATLTLGKPGNYIFSLIGRFGTGLPYTPEFQNVQVSFENSGRRPDIRAVDIYMYKNFKVSRLGFQFFIRVFNLFDSGNEIIVFNDTGRASYTLAPLYVGGLHPRGINTLDSYFVRPDYYSEPRQIQLGLDFQF
jgi:outer membrane receptor protein involved in Fe transport